MTRSYCAEQVRRYDNDRYLTALLASPERREALFTLYAFNIEVAKTREAVSEPMIGQIRLQWWREAIEEVFAGSARRHAVVTPLAEVAARYGLDRARFDRLIDARERDLDDRAPATMEKLSAYIDATSGELVQLALEVLGATGEAERAAATEVGAAWGLTGLLRAVPFHARAKRVYLPSGLMAEEGAELDDLFELRGGEALARTVLRIADAARGSLSRGRAVAREVDRAARPALMVGRLADLYLDRIERARGDLFGAPVTVGQPARQFALLGAQLRGRY